MKKSIKLALPVFLILSTSSLYATNGDLMIGQGAKSRSMGGVGIAKSFGAESGLANPALITSVRHSEITGSATIFMPDVSFVGANDLPSKSSSRDLSFIPEFYYVRSVGSFALGIQASGVAGMGVDYGSVAGTTNDNGSFNMNTQLQLFKIAVPLAYKTNYGLSFAVEPVVQIGSLKMNYEAPTGPSDNPQSASTGLGYELGIAYNNAGFTLGGVYKSAIKMEYANNIARAVNDFGLGGAIRSGDILTQPAEMGFGLSYQFHKSTIAFDYKIIAWSDADGYSDFGWEDQSVFAVGFEHIIGRYALRAGYNYAESPIVEQNGASYAGAATNFFNLSGFPGMVEQHFTAGLGYDITNNLSIDTALVYAPEASDSFDISAMSPAPIASADVKHSQFGLSLAMSWKFR